MGAKAFSTGLNRLFIYFAVLLPLVGCSSNPINKMEISMDSMKKDMNIMSASTFAMSMNTSRMESSMAKMAEALNPLVAVEESID